MVKKLLNILPTGITFLSIAAGWVAVVLLLLNNPWTFDFAVLAFMLDCLDGQLARRLGVSSPLGRQLDGFADALIYVFWPALLYSHYFGLQDPFSILVQIVFLVTGIFRLARFNDIGYVAWKGIRGYPGLPVIFSHLIIFLAIVFQFQKTDGLVNGLILVHSFLMVQRFPFPRLNTGVVIVVLLGGLLILWQYL